MASEGFEDEEWDTEFVDKLIQVAEEALLSHSCSTQHRISLFHSPPPPQYEEQALLSRSARHRSSRSRSLPLQLLPRVGDAPAVSGVTHSSVTPQLPQGVRGAPAVSGATHSSVTSISLIHEQSQQHRDKEESAILKRVSDALAASGVIHSRVASNSLVPEQPQQDNDKEENARLKEEEKKERDKKEEQLKFVSSTNEAKEEELRHKNSKKVHHGVGILDHAIPREYQTENSSKELRKYRINISSKEVGIQTDIVGESDNSSSKSDTMVAHRHQNKLLDIWDSSNGQKFGKDLVLKLFSACEGDLQVLFGHLNLSFSSKTKIDAPHMQSAEAAKISHLYFMLTKISNEMVRYEDLLEALTDLCCLNNCTVPGAISWLLGLYLNMLCQISVSINLVIMKACLMLIPKGYWNKAIYNMERTFQMPE